MPPLLNISVPDRWDRVPTDETVWLHLRAECPADLPHAVTIPSVTHPRAEQLQLNRDLIPHDLQLQPGESCSLCIGVRFEQPGKANLREFYVQANHVTDSAQNQLIPLPDHSFTVVPSLRKELIVTVERICEYDDAVKLEVTVRHQGTTDFTDVVWTFGPPERVRSGVNHRRLPSFRPGAEVKCELVVVGDTLAVEIGVTANGERIANTSEHGIPAEGERATTSRSFTFLEPKKLTTDRIELKPEKSGDLILPKRGVYTVRGAKSRYVLTIFPTHPNATSVRVLNLPGRVEVEPRANIDGGWQFLITIVEDPKMTGGVRLDYDVRVGSELMQGELHLAIRPSNWTLWLLAITAGAALTTKGLIALGPTLFKPTSWDGLIDNFADVWSRRWFDWMQLLFIPIFRSGLWIADTVQRQFQDG